MRVEAIDTTRPSVMCVATIKEVKQGRVLIHYDGWGSDWDFWCDASSTSIHPPMWSGKNGKKITPPPGIVLLMVMEGYYVGNGMSNW